MVLSLMNIKLRVTTSSIFGCFYPLDAAYTDLRKAGPFGKKCIQGRNSRIFWNRYLETESRVSISIHDLS